MWGIEMAWRCDWCGGPIKLYNGVWACEHCRKSTGKDGHSFNDGHVKDVNLKG